MFAVIGELKIIIMCLCSMLFS